MKIPSIDIRTTCLNLKDGFLSKTVKSPNFAVACYVIIVAAFAFTFKYFNTSNHDLGLSLDLPQKKIVSV